MAYACKKAPMYVSESDKLKSKISGISERDSNACLLSEAISKFMFWCDQNLEKASRWSKKRNSKMTIKGGRPRLSASQKKKYKVDVKMSTEDYYTLKSKALKAGMTINEYMRQCIHDSSIRERLNPEHHKLIRQLSGMANNLNQIARKANAQGYDNARSEYLHLAEKIDQLLNEL